MNKHKGLSLVELLVVMVLTSLIATLMMQGFGFTAAMYQRVTSRKQTTQMILMSNQWFVDVNENLLVGKSLEKSLVGDLSSYKAVTLSPLFGSDGLPTQIQWKLIDDGAFLKLVYFEGGVSIDVRKRLASSTEFQYMNTNGRWFDRWPHARLENSLPKAVRIVDPLGVEEAGQVAYVQMRLKPDLTLEDTTY